SDAPFFTDTDAVQPIADGALYEWRSVGDSEAPFNVVFARAGARYNLIRTDKRDEPMNGVMFVPIPSTPEDDYIVQAQLHADDPSTAYAFMWRDGRGYRVFLDPRAFNADRQWPARAHDFCEERGYGECHFRKRDDVV